MEYGMAAEPSVLGAKIKFWQDNTPSEYHTLYRLEDIDQFPEYEVEADAFAALTLHRYGMDKQRILDHGYILPLVTARGPLCTAGFVRSTTNLMIELVENPEGQPQADRSLHARRHRLAESAAQGPGRHRRRHLHPRRHRRLHQRRALHGVRASVLEAHLRRVSEGLGEDLPQRRRGRRLPRPSAGCRLQRAELGQAEGHPRGEAARRRSHVPDGQRQPARDRACAARPTKCSEATLDVLEGAGGEGIILSVGGGVSPGMPRENILAMLEALEEFNAQPASSATGARLMVDYALMNQCLYEGKAKEVEQMTREALAEGRAVQEVLTDGLIAGMSVVGEDFKHNILYVPGGADRRARDEGRHGRAQAAAERADGGTQAGRRAADGHRARRSARHRQEPRLHDGRRRGLRGPRHRRRSERREVHGRRRSRATPTSSA